MNSFSSPFPECRALCGISLAPLPVSDAGRSCVRSAVSFLREAFAAAPLEGSLDHMVPLVMAASIGTCCRVPTALLGGAIKALRALCGKEGGKVVGEVRELD